MEKTSKFFRLQRNKGGQLTRIALINNCFVCLKTLKIKISIFVRRFGSIQKPTLSVWSCFNFSVEREERYFFIFYNITYVRNHLSKKKKNHQNFRQNNFSKTAFCKKKITKSQPNSKKHIKSQPN